MSQGTGLTVLFDENGNAVDVRVEMDGTYTLSVRDAEGRKLLQRILETEQLDLVAAVQNQQTLGPSGNNYGFEIR